MARPLTPYGAYLKARFARGNGEKLSVEECGNDPALLFAAVLGHEDGARAALKPDHRIPTEASLMQAIRTVLGLVAPLTSGMPRPASARGRIGASLLDDIADDTKAKMREDEP